MATLSMPMMPCQSPSALNINVNNQHAFSTTVAHAFGRFVNSNNWDTSVLNSAHTSATDDFEITVNGTTVSARRTDAPGVLWGLNLAFMCCSKPCFNFNAGVGGVGTTTVSLPVGREGATCPVMVNRSNWITSSTSTAAFRVLPTSVGRSVAITRLDNSGGPWGMDLTFQCCTACFAMLVGPGTGIARVALPSDRTGATCPAVVNNLNYLASQSYPDSWTTALTAQGTGLIVTRTDSPGSNWGMYLAMPCCSAIPMPATPPCFLLSVGPGQGTVRVPFPVDRYGATCPTNVNLNNWDRASIGLQ